MLTGEKRSQIDKIWNAFWTGGISNPLTVIEQITYLLFIKRLDENQINLENKAAATGQMLFDPIYPKDKENLRWNSFKNRDPETMFGLFVQPDGVFDFMRNMGEHDSTYQRLMKGATFMIPTPRLLAQVVDMLDDVEMNNRDTKGDVYEYLLSKIATAGQNGQFRTPRHIIRLVVEMMKPQPDDVICDPSAGSCGFLVAASEYIRAHHAASLFKNDFKKHFNERMFMGMEFDATMLRIGSMNMIMHGIENPHIQNVDALSEDNRGFTEQATMVLANPPFKGSLDGDVVEKHLHSTVKTKKTELLFLALLLRGLKTGGRAAVIVPDGVLFGSSNAHRQIREEIIDRHQLQAVVSMPGGVFKPYAGVSTAVLFFTKTGKGGTKDVWFYDMQADGFSLDDKRQEVAENDIPDILHRWNHLTDEQSRTRTDQSFFVPVADIRANHYDLSLNRYKEVVYESRAYESPQEIIRQIKQTDAERQHLLAALEADLDLPGL